MKIHRIAQGDSTTRIKQAIIFISRETGVDISRAQQFVDALYQNLGDVPISQLKNALDTITPEESDKYHNPVQMPQAVTTPLGSVEDTILQTSKIKL